jgi:hypothetical protein
MPPDPSRLLAAALPIKNPAGASRPTRSTAVPLDAGSRVSEDRAGRRCAVMAMGGALLEGAVVLAMAVLVVVLGVRLLQAGSAPSRPLTGAPARWVAAHHSDGTTTRISVDRVDATGRVLESRAVDSVLDEDPDYDASFLEALARAQSRAELLNSADPG